MAYIRSTISTSTHVPPFLLLLYCTFIETAMTSHIYLVRHAESEHNVSKDFSKLDPPLTTLGIQQATQLVQTFPRSSEIGIILSSPLQRTLQTTLAAFSHVLDKRYFDPLSGKGVENGVKLVLDPDLQERSALPCDTGSSRDVLEAAFPNLDFEGLGPSWPSKDGIYAADDTAVEARARRVRTRLAEISTGLEGKSRKNVVVVTHGAFMKFLSGEPEIDLPKAGWKSYTVAKDSVGGIILVPVEEPTQE